MRSVLVAAAGLALVGLVALRFGGPFGVLLLGGALVCLVIGLVGGSGSAAAGAASATASPPPGPAAAPKPAAAPSDRVRWDRAEARHDEVLSEYAAYELNPEMLLRFPAMWDLGSPKVMAFHDALEHASALRTDAYPGPGESAREYAEAVTDLRTAWFAADRHARSTGTSALDPDDAKDLDRGLKLLRHAEATESAERAAYLNQVVGTVDRMVDRGVVAAPPKFRAELQARARKAIEG